MARIFVVDDDQDLADSTKTVLERSGYEVTVFYDARSAIDEAKKQKPDLFIMDMLMPHFSGAEAVKELKNTSELNKIPIVILTGLLSPDEYMEMTRIAIDGKTYKTLSKPYEIEELQRVVEESLKWTQFN